MMKRPMPGRAPDWADDGNSTDECLTAYRWFRTLPTREKEPMLHLRMDMVEKELVGGVNIEKLYKSAIQGCKPALRYLLKDPTSRRAPAFVSESEYQEKIERRNVPWVCREPDRRLNEPMSLVVSHMALQCGLYGVLTSDRSRNCLEKAQKITSTQHPEEEGFHPCLAGVSTVRKPGKHVSDEVKAVLPDGCPTEVHRMITDARQANAWMKDDSSFPMFQLSTLFQVYSNAFARSQRSPDKRFYIINADLRHWYHQLGLPEELGILFQLNLHNGQVMIPNALPMGWSLACKIGQSATWALILGRGNQKSEFEHPKYIMYAGEEKSTAEQPPTWIPFVAGKGGILVILDNIFVVTDDEIIAKYWSGRLKQRAEECAVIFKKEGTLDPTRVVVMEHGSSVSQQFMGIEFFYDGWKTLEKEDHNYVLEGDSFTGSYKQLLSHLGVVLWDLRVRCEQPRKYKPFLKLYTLAHPKVNEDWDCMVTLKGESFKVLREYLLTAQKRVFRSPLLEWVLEEDDIVQRWAVDASGKRIAAVPISHAGLKEAKPWYGKKNTFLETEIALAELDAILLAVKMALKLEAKTKLLIVATDSMVAKGWAEKTLSANVQAQRMLDEIFELLEKVGARIVLPYVPTKDNWADVPTRSRIAFGKVEALYDEATAESRKKATERLLESTCQKLHHLLRDSGRIAVKIRRERPLVNET